MTAAAGVMYLVSVIMTVTVSVRVVMSVFVVFFFLPVLSSRDDYRSSNGSDPVLFVVLGGRDHGEDHISAVHVERVSAMSVVL